MPTIGQLPPVTSVNPSDLLALAQGVGSPAGGVTGGCTVALLLGGTQPELVLPADTLLGRWPGSSGPPQPITLAGGLSLSPEGILSDAAGGGPAGEPYDITLYRYALPAAPEPFISLILVRPLLFPIGLAGSLANAKVAATNPVVLAIRHNGIPVGQVNFTAGNAAGTFTFPTALDTAAGDEIEITMPSAADATLAQVRITLTGTR